MQITSPKPFISEADHRIDTDRFKDLERIVDSLLCGVLASRSLSQGWVGGYTPPIRAPQAHGAPSFVRRRDGQRVLHPDRGPPRKGTLPPDSRAGAASQVDAHSRRRRG